MNYFLLLATIFFCSVNFQLFGQIEKDFYDTDRVVDIRLNFKKANWAELLDSLRIYGDDLLMASAYIDGKEYKNVGVRYRGSRSFTVGGKRNSLHIKLNYINKNQNHQGYKKIKISNSLRDPSMIREVMAYEVARKYMPAPKANHCKVYVNGSYYGLYTNVEDISTEFLEKHFNSSDNSFFKCSPDISKKSEEGCRNKAFASLEYEEGIECYFANYEIKSENGWDDLIELTRVLDQEPENINKVLDVDNTLWMLAFNNAIVNLSSYSGQNSQNYYLYKDNNGQFNPIIWDLNLAFGSFKNTGSGSDLNLKALQEMDPLLHIDNVTKPLISKLLSNDQYKKIYLAHLRTIIYDNFVNGEYEERAKEMQRLINVPLYEDKNRFYESADYEKSLTSTVGKRSKIPGIVELMKARASYLKKEKNLAVVPVKISDINVKNREKLSKDKIENFAITCKVDRFPKKVNLYYRQNSEDTFKSIRMRDDGKNGDGTSGDGVFGVSIDPEEGQSKIEFYIEAQNAKSIDYQPKNYMFTSMMADLELLNK